jgi:O-antigen/teichoic acid export membrane protein
VLFSVSYYNAPVMTAAGRPEFVFRLTLLNAVLNVAAFLIGVRWGILGVAIGYAVRGYLVFPLNLALLRRAIGLAPRRYLAAIAPSLAATAATTVLTLLLAHAVPMPSQPALKLAALACAAVAIHATILLIAFRPAVAGVLAELESMAEQRPGVAARLRALHRRIAAPKNR